MQVVKNVKEEPTSMMRVEQQRWNAAKERNRKNPVAMLKYQTIVEEPSQIVNKGSARTREARKRCGFGYREPSVCMLTHSPSS